MEGCGALNLGETVQLPDFSFWKDRIPFGTLCAVYVSGYDQGRAAGRIAYRNSRGRPKSRQLPDGTHHQRGTYYQSGQSQEARYAGQQWSAPHRHGAYRISVGTINDRQRAVKIITLHRDHIGHRP